MSDKMSNNLKQTEFDLTAVPSTREERDKLLKSTFFIGDIVEELNKRVGSYYIFGANICGNMEACRQRAMEDLKDFIGDAKIVVVQPIASNVVIREGRFIEGAKIDADGKFAYVDAGFRYASEVDEKPVDSDGETA